MNINDYKKNNRFKTNVWDSGIEFVACGKVSSNFHINLSPTVKAKIDVLMKEFPNIEWLSYLLGDIDWDNNRAQINDLYIPEKQTINATLVNEIECSGINNVVGVIHSHHNMSVEFSSTDNEYINKHNDISIVVSHTNMNAVVRCKTPCGCFAFIKPTISLDLSSVINESDFLTEIREKIKEPSKTNIDNIVLQDYFDRDEEWEDVDGYFSEEDWEEVDYHRTLKDEMEYVEI